MKKNSLWAGLLGAIVLCGCDGGPNPFDQKYVPPRLQPPPQQKLMVRKQTIGFVYVPVNKRDPFRAPYLTQSDTNPTPATNTRKQLVVEKKREPQTELEKFELDQLTVVATITGVANPVAMVQDPKGVGHSVRRGTIIGRNAGRVQRIHSDGIVIEQESRDEAGRRLVSRVKLRIKEDNADKSAPGKVLIEGRPVNF